MLIFVVILARSVRHDSFYGKILAFAIILYRLLKLRNFQDCMIRIRWQMPTYSVGASCFFIQSGILRPQQMKGIKDDIYASFIPEGLRIPLHFYFPHSNDQVLILK